MRKRKILVALGTRPEAIKLAPVIRELEKSDDLAPVVCVTGQHRHLADQAMSAFGLTPDYDLNIMRPDQNLTDAAGRILLGLREVIDEVSPDMTIVQGDTITCLAGSLASFYAGIPIGHVEAGLRTGNLKSPFPEEANRTMVSCLASLHFAPTEEARENLLSEGVAASQIHVTGNTVVDALGMAREDVDQLSGPALTKIFGAALAERLSESKKPAILITGHRRENFGGPLSAIVDAIRELATKHPDWCFAYVVHSNPNAREAPASRLSGVPNIFLLEPLEYVPFIWLVGRANLIVSDSGGLVEEATALGTPILITRQYTERLEAVAVGAATLVGTSRRQIVAAVEASISRPRHSTPSEAREVFGTGNAARSIVDIVSRTLLGQNPLSGVSSEGEKRAAGALLREF